MQIHSIGKRRKITLGRDYGKAIIFFFRRHFYIEVYDGHFEIYFYLI